MQKYSENEQMDNIRAFFSPDSVVVIGAADRQGSVANAILKNLLTGRLTIYQNTIRYLHFRKHQI